eukprot:TRINITY_DN5262_c0_g1_i4.p1 TRINITY_DN5262_c0_g1~~TRINITY_DN5262_c0_g1_i4.p1  ORF type:complete len:340 (-),score=27.25 TRINITY_DN5262_c0_g1_i4:8-1027(-)
MMRDALRVLALFISLGLSSCTGVLRGTCSLTNAHPESTGVYMTLGYHYLYQMDTYRSATVAFNQTAYFYCEPQKILFLRVYDTSSTDQVVPLHWTPDGLSCQATNMFTIEPRTFNSSTYDVDLEDFGRGDIARNHTRFMMLNTGYDGPLFWQIQNSPSLPWTNFTTYVETPFDISHHQDLFVPNLTSAIRVRASTLGGAVVATSSQVSLSQYDAQTQIHFNLLGSNGVHSLEVVHGCNETTSNCNLCPPTAAPTPAPTRAPRVSTAPTRAPTAPPAVTIRQTVSFPGLTASLYTCLLYTSDAADEEDSVDLGGRRIIKKKKKKHKQRTYTRQPISHCEE